MEPTVAVNHSSNVTVQIGDASFLAGVNDVNYYKRNQRVYGNESSLPYPLPDGAV